MPRQNVHDRVTKSFLGHLAIQEILNPSHELPLNDVLLQLQANIATFRKIKNTRYLQDRTSIPKAGNIHLAWEYAKDPAQHHLFIQMLRVSPLVFRVIVELIKDHNIFRNDSNVPQAPVDYQLAVTLFRMGRFGNAASLIDIARDAGCSTGSVENFTDRCFTAIESLHGIFVQPLTAEEKEVEKQWIDKQMGFKGKWRDGWVMYDGTIVVLYARPGLDGDAY